jgi:hypothetical protein
MKKTILSIGLFTLVLASTSFAAPTSSSPSIDAGTAVFGDGTGSQDAGGNKKVDYTGEGVEFKKTTQIADGDGWGSQDTGRTRKVD